jgi:hypothetical protein
MGQIILDTDVLLLHYKRQLPAEVRQHMLGQTKYVTFATAGELRKWQVTRDWGWARRTVCGSYGSILSRPGTARGTPAPPAADG